MWLVLFYVICRKKNKNKLNYDLRSKIVIKNLELKVKLNDINKVVGKLFKYFYWRNILR